MSEPITRRQLILRGSAVVMTGLAARDVLSNVTAPATASAAEKSADLEILAPGSVAAPVVGTATDGTHAYTVSRGLTPATVGVYSIADRDVTANIELPSGDGGWGATLSGDDFYVGTYGTVADLHRVHPATGDVRMVMRLPQDTFIWDLATAPDGTVVAGSSPTGRVLTYDPDTDAIHDYGPADPAQMYVRSVAADDEFIFAGTGAHANLVRIARSSGDREAILPSELTGESWVYALTLSSDLVVGGTGPSGKLVLFDRSNLSDYTVVETGKTYIDQVRVADGAVWFTTRPDGALMRYDLSTGSLTQVAVPSPGDETRLIHIFDRNVFGVTGSGASWYVDRASDAVDVVDLQDAGLRAGPEPVQSLTAAGGLVYVGGHWSFTEHRPDAGKTKRVRVQGEPKAMTTVGPRMYFAEYPGGTIGEFDDTNGYTKVGIIPRSALQDRPRDITYDPPSGLLVIASMAEYGYLDGALTTFDPATHKTDAYRGLIDDQTVDAVVVHRHIAYLATQISASALEPTTTQAHLAAFDLTSRKLIWVDVPLPEQETIRHLAFLNGQLYGYTGDGTVFAYSLRDRRVRKTTRVGGLGDIRAWSGRLFVATGDQVLELDPTTLESTVLADHLAGDWFNEPQLAIDDGSRFLYTLTGRRLARLRI
jgi:streptogramin lyase